MSAILNSLNAHNFLIFQPILMTLVSKFKVQRALSDRTYLLLGLRSPLTDKADKPDLLQSTRRPFKSMDLALSCEVNRQCQRNRAILGERGGL